MISSHIKNLIPFLKMALISTLISCVPKPAPNLIGVLALPLASDASRIFQVLSSNPSQNQSGVDVNINPTITFSKSVESATVTGNLLFTQPAINKISSISATTLGQVITLKPNVVFGAASSYTITVRVGIKSTFAESLTSEYILTFTTQ